MIEEALGYKVRIDEVRGVQNLDAVLSLTGCNSLECSSRDTDVSHVALEAWLGAYGSDYDAFKQKHPDLVPEDLGSIGYAGEEAMFVSKFLVQDAYQDRVVQRECFWSSLIYSFPILWWVVWPLDLMSAWIWRHLWLSIFSLKPLWSHQKQKKKSHVSLLFPQAEDSGHSFDWYRSSLDWNRERESWSAFWNIHKYIRKAVAEASKIRINRYK